MTRRERMSPGRCKNGTQRGHLRYIEEFGVSIISVAPSGTVAPTKGNHDTVWTYSIGFWQQYGHPEVIIIGLDGNTAGAGINELNRRIRDRGQRFESGAVVDDLLSGDFRCYFQAVEPAKYGDWLVGNSWFYGDESFPVVQMIWPDLKRAYPWQEGVDPAIRRLQPLLCSLPKRAMQ
jgi:hypothetical protein